MSMMRRSSAVRRRSKGRAVTNRATTFLGLIGVVGVIAGWTVVHGQKPAAPACDPGNGGLTLPPGFCATVIADDLGYARNLAVAANGDVYVSIRTGARAPGQPMQPGLSHGAARYRRRRHDGPERALRHQRRHRPACSATATSTSRRRRRSSASSSARDNSCRAARPKWSSAASPPSAATRTRTSPSTTRATSTSPSACRRTPARNPDRQPGAKGMDPCPQLEEAGGVWKFSADTPGQTYSPKNRYATGMRQGVAIAWHDGHLYLAMNSRDSLDTMYPGPLHARGEPEPAARAAAAGGRGRRLRLALLLPRRPDQQDDPGAGVRRRRQGSRPLRAVRDADRRLPRPLRAGGHPVLQRRAAAGEVSRRRLRGDARLVEPRAGADGRLQRPLPAVRQGQAERPLRGVRRRLQGQGRR